MNKKQLLFLILIFFLIYSINAYSASSGILYSTTDEELFKLAVDKGLIPKNPDREWGMNETKKGNTILVWIALNREDKIELIERLKKLFKQDGIIISNTAVHYVDQINRVMISNIRARVDHQEGEPGIKRTFQTLAAMEGDYDDSRDKLEVLREFLGEEMLEFYKKDHPEQYDYLFKADGEN